MTDTATRVGAAPRAEEQRFTWRAGRLVMSFAHSPETAPRIAAVAADGVALTMPAGLPLVDLLTVAGGRTPASDRLVHTATGAALRYREHREEHDGRAPALKVDMVDAAEQVLVRLRLTASATAPVVRARATVRNLGADRIVLRSVTTFSSYLGAGSGERPTWTLFRGASDWLGEGRWSTTPLDGAAFPRLAEELTGHDPRGEVRVSSLGTWSTGRDLPTAAIVSDDATWLWQIEHNGGWRFDVGQDSADHWFSLSGPTDDDHQWVASLAPGDEFETVPAAVAVAAGLPAAIDALTTYRRAARRQHVDNAAMPVVFNDYMNTVNGDPTTDRLLPLIDAAAAAGAEVFCVDAGWYADGFWWDSVGEWRPSERRFPGGLGLVMDHIRDLGMIPGLWLEPEVIGVNSPMADRLPAAAFLQRHGQRVAEHGRYHLDLRHPAAIAHLDEVIDRLVVHYGVGFFKFDYNINPGPGTDRASTGAGDGLLQHNRAHLAWLDTVLDRHPSLIVENCASGGMRSDFAMLSRLQMQSTSDQQDWIRYPPIAAAAPMQMLPEQAASWAYPQPEMTEEEVAFCLVTGLLGRFYLSGYLNRMSAVQRRLVSDAIAVAKQLRTEIASAAPVWPLGLPGWDDDAVALGLMHQGVALVSVWDRRGDAELRLDLPALRGSEVEIAPIFPTSLPSWTTAWEAGSGTLRVHNPTGQVGARLFRITSLRGSGD